jgi:hypothetical protein
MNAYIFNSWFKDDFLQKEFVRLFSLFVPHETVPDVRVVVGEKSPNGEAAHALLDLRIVVMYADYHLKNPQEYKMTLLHEAGHFLFNTETHDDFSDYFSLLSLRQKFINERVLPSHAEDFIYCGGVEESDYTFACSGCGDRVISEYAAGVMCTSCDRNMLLVGGL